MLSAVCSLSGCEYAKCMFFVGAHSLQNGTRCRDGVNVL